MEARQGTWKEIGPSVVLRDPSLKHWLVIDEAPRAGQPARPDGKRFLRIRGQWKEERTIERRPDDEPVTIMEASETEAVMLAGFNTREGGLAAAVIRRENDKTLPLRAMRFRMDPVDVAGKGAKERIHWHVDEYHSVYLEPSMTAKKAAEAHEEMHAAEHMEMSTPHHHGGTR